MGVFGLEEAPRLLRHLIKYSSAKRMRKTAQNRQVFASGTCSYPKPWLFIADSPFLKEYEDWKSECLNFLKMEFGNDLFHVLEHRDERYAHLHFFVMPKLKPDGSICLTAHPGRYSNELNWKLNPSVKREKYKQAMRDLLNRFYQFVSSKFGFSRKSENVRKRVSRQKWEDELREISDKKILNLLGYNFNKEKCNVTSTPRRVMKPRF